MPDYEGMTKKELEAEAARRTPEVNLTGVTSNLERIARLQADDDLRAVAAAPAEIVPEPSTSPQVEQVEQVGPDFTDYSTRQLPAATPYPTEQDRQNRIDNAGGAE